MPVTKDVTDRRADGFQAADQALCKPDRGPPVQHPGGHPRSMHEVWHCGGGIRTTGEGHAPEESYYTRPS